MILLDTDVLLGVALGREPHLDASVAAARACGARVIATRNVRDYRGSPIPARIPAELLEEIG